MSVSIFCINVNQPLRFLPIREAYPLQYVVTSREIIDQGGIPRYSIFKLRTTVISLATSIKSHVTIASPITLGSS